MGWSLEVEAVDEGVDTVDNALDAVGRVPAGGVVCSGLSTGLLSEDPGGVVVVAGADVNEVDTTHSIRSSLFEGQHYDGLP